MRNLSCVSVGETARVKQITNKSKIRRRLFDLGLIPETETECVGQSPSGDPKAFLIRGAVIALRNEDLGEIIIY